MALSYLVVPETPPSFPSSRCVAPAVIHPLAYPQKQGRCPRVTVTAVPGCLHSDINRQPAFSWAGLGTTALRIPGLPHHPARPPPIDSRLVNHSGDHLASPWQARQLPRAASLTMALSGEIPVTSFFSPAFSIPGSLRG